MCTLLVTARLISVYFSSIVCQHWDVLLSVALVVATSYSPWLSSSLSPSSSSSGGGNNPSRDDDSSTDTPHDATAATNTRAHDILEVRASRIRSPNNIEASPSPHEETEINFPTVDDVESDQDDDVPFKRDMVDDTRNPQQRVSSRRRRRNNNSDVGGPRHDDGGTDYTRSSGASRCCVTSGTDAASADSSSAQSVDGHSSFSSCGGGGLGGGRGGGYTTRHHGRRRNTKQLRRRPCPCRGRPWQ